MHQECLAAERWVDQVERDRGLDHIVLAGVAIGAETKTTDAVVLELGVRQGGVADLGAGLDAGRMGETERRGARITGDARRRPQAKVPFVDTVQLACAADAGRVGQRDQAVVEDPVQAEIDRDVAGGVTAGARCATGDHGDIDVGRRALDVDRLGIIVLSAPARVQVAVGTCLVFNGVFDARVSNRLPVGGRASARGAGEPVLEIAVDINGERGGRAGRQEKATCESGTDRHD